jgi:rhodanese-related sulfurtransferase
MNKNYIFLTVLAFVIGLGILFMPETKREKQIKPVDLLMAIDDPSRFLSTDVITDRLVKKDPTLLLIDVRIASQYNSFSIPGAINIPLDSLLTGSTAEILQNKDIDKVFYSNADVTSDQAWIISKRLGYKAIYVLQGGVNKWFNTIVKNEIPADTEPVEVFELYQFRKGASQFFFGSNESGLDQESKATPKKTVVIQKKVSEASTGGGC